MTTAYGHLMSVNVQKAKDTQLEDRELPKYGKTYGYPPSMRHAAHTLTAYDVSLLPQC